MSQTLFSPFLSDSPVILSHTPMFISTWKLNQKGGERRTDFATTAPVVTNILVNEKQIVVAPFPMILHHLSSGLKALVLL